MTKDEVPLILQKPPVKSWKAPAMEAFLDDLSQASFGRSRTGAIGQQTCVACGKLATEFKDELSKKEYTISGLCQVCQDDVFGGAEE